MGKLINRIWDFWVKKEKKRSLIWRYLNPRSMFVCLFVCSNMCVVCSCTCFVRGEG